MSDREFLENSRDHWQWDANQEYRQSKMSKLIATTCFLGAGFCIGASLAENSPAPMGLGLIMAGGGYFFLKIAYEEETTGMQCELTAVERQVALDDLEQ